MGEVVIENGREQNFNGPDMPHIEQEEERVGEKSVFVSALESELASLSRQWSVRVDSEEFAKRLDKEDPLRDFKRRFHYPTKRDIAGEKEAARSDEACIYMCGQSLGLQLKAVKEEVQEVLRNWATRGVESHFCGKYPAASCDTLLKEDMAHLVGAEPSEVAIMNGLTVNIHVLLSAFYRPTEERHKILMVENGFHSDLYAVQSHVRLRGFDPGESVVFLRPRQSCHTIDPKDILETLEDIGHEISVVFLEGVHFYTGQLFDMRSITRAGHKQGCVVGFDLAHAVGNVELKLHDWGVDFAMWCTYKYLNCGAGCLGTLFVHDQHSRGSSPVQPMMAGWWGIQDKFSLDREFRPAEGADRFKISNPSPLLAAVVAANLKVFREAGISRLVQKQRLLTGYLEYLLRRGLCDGRGSLSVITPGQPGRRGCQLSLISGLDLGRLENALKRKGVVCDVRRPSVLRVTPAPLYTSFADVHGFVRALEDAFTQTFGSRTPE